MKTFFRLEGPDGYGVYSSERFFPILERHDLRFGKPTSPAPWCDKGLCRSADEKGISIGEIKWTNLYRFGFTSKKKLLSWFHPNVLSELAANGLKIICKKIPSTEIISGDTQDVIPLNVYNKYKSEEIPLTEIISEKQIAA